MILREKLQEKGIHTVGEFAKRAGLQTNQAWNYWYGHSQIGLKLARKLSTKLKIPLMQLLNLDPTPKTNARLEPSEEKEEEEDRQKSSNG